MAKTTKQVLAEQKKQAKASAAAPKAAEKAGAEATALVIPTLKAGALSKDVGPMVIKMLSDAQLDEEKGKELQMGAQKRRYDAQGQLTLAIVKAVQADDSINLSTAFGDDKTAMGFLNNQLGIALGFKEVVTVIKGGKEVRTIAYAKAVAPFFPAPGEKDSDPAAYTRKTTLRSNFIHRLKQCSQAAAGIVEKKTKASFDKEHGTLRLSGPAIQEQFGQKEVLLNERQNIEDAKGNEIKLKDKPSFQAIAANAGKSHGVTLNRSSNTRGKVTVDPAAAIETLGKSIIAAIEKLADDKITATVRANLEAVRNAIDVKLG